MSFSGLNFRVRMKGQTLNQGCGGGPRGPLSAKYSPDFGLRGRMVEGRAGVEGGSGDSMSCGHHASSDPGQEGLAEKTAACQYGVMLTVPRGPTQSPQTSTLTSGMQVQGAALDLISRRGIEEFICVTPGEELLEFQLVNSSHHFQCNVQLK